MRRIIKNGSFAIGVAGLILVGLPFASEASPKGASELRTTPIELSRDSSKILETNASSSEAISAQISSQVSLQQPTFSFTKKPMADLSLGNSKTAPFSETAPFKIAQTTDIQPVEPPPVRIEVQSPDQLPSADEVKPTSVEPTRSTRSGPSYIGVGANIGAIGDTSIGDIGLIVYSKIGLTRYFSVRPAVTTNFVNDATFLIPATFDLAPIRLGSVAGRGLSIAPYIGAGAAVTTHGDVGPLLTGGVDIPISSRLTATVGVNAGFLDDIDVGPFVGVGYNF
jgi:hypothetical protein